MGKGKSCSTVGYRYYAGLHLVYCHAADELTEIMVGEKTVWSGSVAANATLTLDKPELHGGEEREGGVQGKVDVEFGRPDQGVNPYLQAVLGGLVPAFRGLFGLVARKCYVAANNPYLKPWAVRARRTRTGWRDDLAEVAGGMNPAHIIRECLTNTDWATLGYPETDLDEQSFLNAANLLKAEGFGLNLLWSRNQSLDDFVSYVLDHVDGILYPSHLTGLVTLKLLRADYNIGGLPVLNPSNVLELVEFNSPSAAEVVNQVTVVYLDRQGNRAATPPAQDLAAIERMAGRINGVSLEFTGIDNEELAARVAARELTQLCVPLASCTLVVNRKHADLEPGSVFNFVWPAVGIASMPMRVIEVEVGMHTEGAIRVKAVRDVFGGNFTAFTAPSASLWSNPILPPAVPAHRRLEELSWWQFIRAFGSSQAVLAELTDQTSMVIAFCARPSSAAINYELWAMPQGGASFAFRDTGNFPEAIPLAASLAPQVESVITLQSAPDPYLVAVGGYALIGDELVAVLGLNGTQLVVTRGVLDTVPAAHPAGRLVWFHQGFHALDPEEYAAGEVVEARLLPATSLGRLSLDAAPTDQITCRGRLMRPYPPGNFRLNSARWPAEIEGALTVFWAHRDRLMQTVEFTRQDTGNIGPESGVTYTLRIYGEAGALLRTVTGLTGTSYTYDKATEKTDSGFNPPRLNAALRVKLESVRAGLTSWQGQDHFVARIGDLETGEGAALPVAQNLVLHLAADAITGLSDGDSVATWNDLSGLNNHAAQANAGLRPTYKTGILNGKPVVRFSASKVLQHPDIETNPAFTYFVVMARAGTGNYAILAVNAGYYPFLDYAAGWYVGPSGCSVARPINTFQIMTGQMVPSANNAKRWINGGAQCTTAGAASGSAAYYLFRFIGAYSADGAGSFVGDIAEIIVYNAALGDADRQAVQNYLAAKYGITLS